MWRKKMSSVGKLYQIFKLQVSNSFRKVSNFLTTWAIFEHRCFCVRKSENDPSERILEIGHLWVLKNKNFMVTEEKCSQKRFKENLGFKKDLAMSTTPLNFKKIPICLLSFWRQRHCWGLTAMCFAADFGLVEPTTLLSVVLEWCEIANISANSPPFENISSGYEIAANEEVFNE